MGAALPGGMHRFLPVLALIALAVPAPAAAGSYVSVGIGESPELSGLPGDDIGGRSGRIMVGKRHGALAIEGGGFGTTLGPASSLVGLAIIAKGHLTLAGPLSLYGKLGLNRGWVRTDTMGTVDSGNGHELGIGADLGLGAGLGHASLWLDFTRQSFDMLSGAQAEIDTTQVGIAFGF